MDDQIAAEFAEWGVELGPDALDEEEVITIWDINRAAFEVFEALDTQWRQVAISGFSEARLIRTGLDYAGVEVVMRNHQLPESDFGLIQAMEKAALSAFAEAG